MANEKPKAAAPTPLSGVPSVDDAGNEPMTSQQADELRALSADQGVELDSTLTREAAARRIAELKDESGIAPPKG